LEVLQILEGEDINQVPVVEGDRLMGMITRDHLLRVLSAKMELDGPKDPGLSRASAATA
jgi:predicted transcriptional regulator